MKKLRVVIIGTGNIGTDLLMKILRSPYLECVGFVGRNMNSAGMSRAIQLNVPCSDHSINFISENSDKIDLVLDATSAKDHKKHAIVLKELGIKAVDMTPAQVGSMSVPAITLDQSLSYDNVSMITCGGQASIPIAYAISKTQKDVDYIEVVSVISSMSAGPATRANLDEYIFTTEAAIKKFTGVNQAKAIINLNPAIPCINMQTSVFAQVQNPDMEMLKEELNTICSSVQSYVPGYKIIVGPLYENGRIVVTVRVRGSGDYLPEYAGNLDIINCAAIALVEEHAKKASER